MTSKKILLIDDDLVLQAIAQDHLTRDGFTVVCASDAATGIQAVIDEKPDIVLLDVILPDSDGYQVCQELS